MRLRTVSSIILPSAHKVKASARNSVTTVVGGGETLRGTLERVPRTPQNFSQILYWRGWGCGAERGLAPGGGCAPARHLFALTPRCLVGGRGAVPLAALAIPAPGERTISNAEVPLPRSPLSLAAGTVQRKAFPAILAANRGLPFAPGTCLAGSVSAANGLMPGMQGAEPLA